MDFKTLKRGLTTGLFLQLAIGPVFFLIINLTLQKSIYDGFAGVLAVTLVDYFYITLAILGIGKLLEKKKINRIFGIISSVVLILFGIWIIKGVLANPIITDLTINSTNILTSFISVLILTLSSPLTIVFFSCIFTSRAVEYKYNKKQLWAFGISVGFATLLFMGCSVLVFNFLRNFIPPYLIMALNILVGIVLILYGVVRIIKLYKK